ncbi:hypothetical protein Salat_1822600 [Sesamum alatum]|uniref:Uncharacterized protein n=1 Tax=Sesamum alatum TaxID=300844 RepID=A0AAE2CHJ8_9LAMI|nr:hypothetical protein Salat_1822600 [Sesamum alatum]
MVEEGARRNATLMEEIQLCTNWDDVTCPICLDFPHNSVLLQCSSFDKGCRPFVCDTDHLHSNCLDRYKEANGMLSGSQSPSSADNLQFLDSGPDSKPACPLCRGKVTGWIVVDKARLHLDVKKRCCEEAKCSFTGTYLELQKHAQVEHPHACPSKIDPARQLDWENFQQSSEIIDVLSTIHSEVPHGVVLGDYVIEYGDDNSGDDFDEFRGDERNWWTSCILYQIFENFRTSRNRRRSRNMHTITRMRLMVSLRLQGNCQGEELVNAALAGAAPASMTTRIEFAVAVVRKESSQFSVTGKWMHRVHVGPVNDL